MILVIGGVGAGKRSYVIEQLGFCPEDIAEGILDGKPVAAGVEQLVREENQEGLISHLLEKQVAVCTEVGCGVVPVDPLERTWREAVGRLCCALAREAEVVVRVSCGIPMVIKGRL